MHQLNYSKIHRYDTPGDLWLVTGRHYTRVVDDVMLVQSRSQFGAEIMFEHALGERYGRLPKKSCTTVTEIHKIGTYVGGAAREFTFLKQHLHKIIMEKGTGWGLYDPRHREELVDAILEVLPFEFKAPTE